MNKWEKKQQKRVKKIQKLARKVINESADPATRRTADQIIKKSYELAEKIRDSQDEHWPV